MTRELAGSAWKSDISNAPDLLEFSPMSPVMKKYLSREDGFTLVELLIVVLIIGVLAAIAIPVYLGIQQQGYKSVVRSDVNQAVKRVQVAVTEGTDVATVKANYASYGVKASRTDESVYMANSPSAGSSASRDYQIVGTMDKTATPAGPINYTYTYDSFTGKFGESDTASSTPQIVLGSGTTTLPNAYVNQSYTAQIDATVTGGTGTTQYASTALPAGLNLNQNTGAITGTPTATGTYPITVTVTNGSLSSTAAYVIRVYQIPSITTTNLPAGVVNQDYSQTLTTTGYPAPTFAISTGSLPAGLSLDANTGKISGKPTANGSSTFSVTAQNAGGTSSAVSYTIVVNTAPSISTSSLPSGGAYLDYSATVSATGSPAPTFSAQNLPTGLSIDSSTGAISGKPTTGGNYTNVQVSATNAGGTDTKTYTINVVNGNAAPTNLTGAGINRFSTQGGNTTSYYNYMWADSATCATGTLEYHFLDKTTGYNRTSTWQTWSNFEIFSPTPVGVQNTWGIEFRCVTGSYGTETAASPVLTGGDKSFMAVPANSNLLTNAGFENNNLNNWGVGAGSFSSLGTTGGSANGSGSYVAYGNTPSGNGASLEQDLGGSAPAGTTYYGTIWVRSTSGSSGINLCVWNITTSQNNCKSVAVTSQWQQVGVSYTLTSATSQVRLEAYLGNATNYQFDDAQLIKG